MPGTVWEKHQKTVVKTIPDKFPNILRDRQAVNARKVVASGIAEVVSPMEQLRDDFILEKSVYEDKKKRVGDEADGKEAQLIARREKIRIMVTIRKS